MKISVAMTTYNGSRYIIDQLNSIRMQSLQADEVIIFDDCSSDNTYCIVADYIKKYHLNSWTITKNKDNIGWRKNFFQVINNASGNIIFLADQDDIWHCDKIEIMVNALVKNPSIILLASNFDLKFENNAGKHYKIEFLNNSKIVKYDYSRNFLCPQRPGCTYCFRKEIIPFLKKYWRCEFSHDALLWQIAYLMGRLYVLQKPLISFRRHDNNSSPYFKRLESIERGLLILEKLELFVKENPQIINKKKTKSIERYKLFLKTRLEALKYKKSWQMIKLIKFFRTYDAFPKQYLGDIYYFIFRKGYNE